MKGIVTWARNRPFIAGFFIISLLICATVGPVILGMYLSQQKMIEYQVQNKIDTCEAANNSRSALLSVLDRVGDPPAAGVEAVRLTEGDEYEALDPITQAYLQWLQGQLDAQPSGSANIEAIAADLRESNPPDVDCEAVGDELRKELEGFSVF